MMAVHGNNFIRVRLHFDYPPPAAADCRMCWLLVDLNRCRVVSDLEGLIREKFEFSRRSILNLFIEDCYLPHTESVYVVRDNDSVRVKLGHLAPVNGHSSSPVTDGETCRKRQRPAEEDGAGETLKKKKKKKRSEGSQERVDKQADGGESNTKSQEKHKEKKKRKEAEESGPAATPKPAAPTKKTPTSVEQPVKNTKKLPAKPQKASSSDSSSSSEDEAPKKTVSQKPAPKTSSSTPAASKVPLNTKKKPPPPSSSSSSSETSSDDAESAKNPPKKKLLNSAIPKKGVNAKPQHAPPPPQTSTNPAQKPSSSAALPPRDKPAQSSSSDSEEEIQFVIRRPVQPAQQLGRGLGIQSPGRGRGRCKMRGGGPAERGRGEGRGSIRGHNNSFEFNYNGATEPSYQTDSLTNTSFVIQNRTESVPKKDYSSMPLLAAPPQVGQKIAFKLLELTENYTPEVSEYKEGQIVSFDLTTKQVELDLLCSSQAPVEPGKFDLVYQNADGSERVEYAVSRGSRVTERWDSLLEPRLII
ncbi:coilin [Tautogolabrus adspersus]